MYDWRKLCTLSDGELARLDIAAVNLACATGLPGAERIDVPGCLRTLDCWASTIRRWTDAAYREFFLPAPEEYENSEAYFRVLAMITCLQRHCGVRYDPSKVGLGLEVEPEFDELFIHGVIEGHSGTCATLPVIYAAVGRRLGYPIKLVAARRHLFCRWEEPERGIRFNIEGSGVGFSSYPDEHYRRWPTPFDHPEVERAFGYLKTFSPRRELANFIAERGYAFVRVRRFREAIETFIQAYELDKEHFLFPATILNVASVWKEYQLALYPPNFPEPLNVLFRRDRRRWPSIPWGVEREIASMHCVEWLLNDPQRKSKYWDPMRSGTLPIHEMPRSITVDYELVIDETTGE